MGALKVLVGGAWVPIGYADSVQEGVYTPTWTNLAVGTGGSAGIQGWYAFMGGPSVGDYGIMHLNGQVVLGTSGFSVGTSPRFDLSAGFNTNQAWSFEQCGGVAFNMAASYLGATRVYNATNIEIRVLGVGATYATPTAVSATVPETWAAGHSIHYQATFRAVRV